MSKYIIVGLISILGVGYVFGSVWASGCYHDPIYERDWHGKYDIAAFVRDNPCMEGTTVVETMPQGTVVQIIAETDGWYKIVTTSGYEGWTGSALMSITDEPLTVSDQESEPVLYSDPGLIDRVRGYILLQVEQHGEAWYVNPDDDLRYYMADGEVAYDMMRNFGLGITDADLDTIPSVESIEEMNGAEDVCDMNAMANRLRGRILLQVEQYGEAWYIDPDVCQRIYMKDGEAAYEIMRYLGLGITDSDLVGIEVGE